MVKKINLPEQEKKIEKFSVPEDLSISEKGEVKEIPQVEADAPSKKTTPETDIKHTTSKPVAADSSAQADLISYEIKQVEDILAEDLEGIYQQMPPDRQAAFKAKGEEVARKIVSILHSAKIRIKDILELIRGWLKLIPGVNKFFLEQEAKIKADKILKSHHHKDS